MEARWTADQHADCSILQLGQFLLQTQHILAVQNHALKLFISFHWSEKQTGEKTTNDMHQICSHCSVIMQTMKGDFEKREAIYRKLHPEYKKYRYYDNACLTVNYIVHNKAEIVLAQPGRDTGYPPEHITLQETEYGVWKNMDYVFALRHQVQK